MKVIDLTHTISEDMPVFPGSETPKLTTKSTYEKDGFTEQFIGKALVVDCRDLKEGQVIAMDKINIDKAKLADFLLFNLGWDKHFKDETYFNDFPYNSRKLQRHWL